MGFFSKCVCSPNLLFNRVRNIDVTCSWDESGGIVASTSHLPVVRLVEENS